MLNYFDFFFLNICLIFKMFEKIGLLVLSFDNN